MQTEFSIWKLSKSFYLRVMKTQIWKRALAKSPLLTTNLSLIFFVVLSDLELWNKYIFYRSYVFTERRKFSYFHKKCWYQLDIDWLANFWMWATSLGSFEFNIKLWNIVISLQLSITQYPQGILKSVRHVQSNS